VAFPFWDRRSANSLSPFYPAFLLRAWILDWAICHATEVPGFPPSWLHYIIKSDRCPFFFSFFFIPCLYLPNYPGSDSTALSTHRLCDTSERATLCFFMRLPGLVLRQPRRDLLPILSFYPCSDVDFVASLHAFRLLFWGCFWVGCLDEVFHFSVGFLSSFFLQVAFSPGEFPGPFPPNARQGSSRRSVLCFSLKPALRPRKLPCLFSPSSLFGFQPLLLVSLFRRRSPLFPHLSKWSWCDRESRLLPSSPWKFNLSLASNALLKQQIRARLQIPLRSCLVVYLPATPMVRPTSRPPTPASFRLFFCLVSCRPSSFQPFRSGYSWFPFFPLSLSPSRHP